MIYDKEENMQETAEKQTKGNKSKNFIVEAYQKIKQMIFDRQLVPGQKLVYQDLAKKLQMSQTPIINALNRLEQEGFVASEVFRGFYVKPLDLSEVYDNFGVREAFEVYAVKQAIQSGNFDDLAKLEDLMNRHAGYNPDHYTRNKFQMDADFHLQIAAMSNNRVMKYLLKRNFEHLFLRTRLENYNPVRMQAAVEEHRRIFERIRKKDVLGAMELMQRHIQNARDHVLHCLSEQEGL
jgi:DNA-binding GntR family transcriptional regulator